MLIQLAPEQLQSCFIEWVNAIRKDIPEVIAVDRRKGLSALHMISAWGTANRLVLGQVATQEKSNDITAIPALLKRLELEG